MALDARGLGQDAGRLRSAAAVFSTTAALSTMPPSKLRRSWLTRPRKSSRLASASSDRTRSVRRKLVGLLTFEGQQLGQHARGLRALEFQGGVRRRPLVPGARRLRATRSRATATLGASGGSPSCTRQIRLVARLEQHRIRFLARAAEHLIGARRSPYSGPRPARGRSSRVRPGGSRRFARARATGRAGSSDMTRSTLALNPTGFRRRTAARNCR